MAKMVKVDVVTRETIKPSSPTPPQLSIFKLSLLGQISKRYTPLILFYSNSNHVNAAQLSNSLKTSLSKALTRFYPFAGRMKDDASIDCNDEGVDYIEARANCHLSEILEQPNLVLLSEFLPSLEFVDHDHGDHVVVSGSLLLVQAIFFDCGGLALAMLASHQLADASSLCTFIKDWAAMALNNNNNNPSKLELSEVVESSLFTPRKLSFPLPKLNGKKCLTKRFVFDALKMPLLKAKASSETVKQPTRVEAVTALLWKCSMAASRSIRGISMSRSSLLGQSIDLRKRFVPPLSENLIAHLSYHFVAHHDQSDEKEMELKDLVCQLRKGIREFVSENVTERIREDGLIIIDHLTEYKNMMTRDETDVYNCSSWCRLPFYEIDFGWGTPTWIALVQMKVPNIVILIDQRGAEGIEAWMSLYEEEMALVECDEELLAFASLNPTVLN